MSSPRPTDHPAQTPTNGHYANGRFAKGNKGGPGNPFARRTAAMRKAIIDAVTPEQLAAIAAVMVKKAQEGDVAAAKLVFSYAVSMRLFKEKLTKLELAGMALLAVGVAIITLAH